MVKKRFFIGFNGILLALFLDVCLLISIRTVDYHGHFQSATDKWETSPYTLVRILISPFFSKINTAITTWTIQKTSRLGNLVGLGIRPL
jgi:hypothetical protein